MKNLFDVSGKVALVTGGSRGIGEMIAHGYVENGAKVYISSRKAEACDETAARLCEFGECISLPNDLANLEGVEKLVAELSEREEKLDILVNNAGAAWGAALEEYPEDGWDKVMDINVKGPFFLTVRLLPLLRQAASEADPARVINIASIDGMHVNPTEHYPYSASKAGMIHLTRALAKRLATDDITVNSVSPGPFESKMMEWTLKQFGEQIRSSNPRKRIGSPEDMAGVCIYLASRAGAYVTGANIPVDGGIVGVS